MADRAKFAGSNAGPAIPAEIEMMKNPARWPLWPWLPLKRVTQRFEEGQWDQSGMLYASHGKPKVFVRKASLAPQKPSEMEQIVYDSYEAVAADGWHID